MILTIELTDTEYVATQKALGKVAALRTLHTSANVIERLELEHLRTLLAEAAAPKKGNSEAMHVLERRPTYCSYCGLPVERCHETNRIIADATKADE